MRGVTLFAALCAAFLVMSPRAEAQSTFNRALTPATYTEQVTTSEFITMRDGVRLAVSITRPARNGVAVTDRLPVIWHAGLDILPAGPGAITPANQVRRFVQERIALAGYGYVVASVARRGAGASFGVRRGYQDRNEANDHYEVVEWLARQSWSSGRVGMVGCSNTGDAVMQTLTMLPPSLRAAFAGCFSWNKYDGFGRGGGIRANWGTGPTRSIEEEMRNVPVQGDEARVLLRQAAEEHQLNTNLAELLAGMPNRDTHSPMTHSRFWYEGSASSYVHQLRRSNVALYIQGGWFDDFRREGLVTYANMPNTPRVIIGPWAHCNNDDFNMTAEMVRFFDYHLKDIDTGIARDDAIHYYTINAPEGQEWRSTNVWPLANTRNERHYLAGQTLSRTQRGRSASFQVRYDAHCENGNLSPTQIQPCHAPGSGVTYPGAVLTEDTEITGHPLVNLWIRANAPNVRVFAYLEDVAPDGTTFVVTEGRLNAAQRQRHTPPYEFLGLPWMRAHAEDARDLTPGAPTELVFDMLPASYVFRAGHRIQITVTGSDFRERDRPQADTPPTITVLNEGRYRSSVTLPIIPSR